MLTEDGKVDDIIGPRQRRSRKEVAGLGRQLPMEIQLLIQHHWNEIEKEFNHEKFADLLECVGKFKRLKQHQNGGV